MKRVWFGEFLPIVATQVALATGQARPLLILKAEMSALARWSVRRSRRARPTQRHRPLVEDGGAHACARGIPVVLDLSVLGRGEAQSGAELESLDQAGGAGGALPGDVEGGSMVD